MWGSEVDQREGVELRTQLSADTRPPNMATLQLNLVQISPRLMPSRERGKGDRGKDGQEKEGEATSESIWDGVS